MYSTLNKFTFENKYLLLEASRLELSNPDQAFIVYQKAIKSASDHKFPHVRFDRFLLTCRILMCLTNSFLRKRHLQVN